jgi:hypothetical protein
MTIDKNISIKIDFGAKGADEIFQNLSVLFSTPKGTVVFDREFGLNFSLLDNPLKIARTLFNAEVIEAVNKYETRVIIKEVQYQADEVKGILKPKVVVDIVGA